MDMLDAILNEMDTHIVSRTSSAYFQQQQEQNRKRKALEEQEKKGFQEFRNKVKKEVQTFLNNNDLKQMRYHPMDKLHRFIIREVATEFDLVSHSFGLDEVFVIVYKQHTAPSPDLLRHLEMKYRGELEEGQVKNCNIATAATTPTTTTTGTTTTTTTATTTTTTATITTTTATTTAATTTSTPATTTPTAATTLSTTPEESTTPTYQRKEKYRKLLAQSDTVFVLNQKKRDLRTIEQIRKEIQAEKKAKPTPPSSI